MEKNTKTKRALKDCVKRYKTLLKTATEAVTVTDLEGRITEVSKRTLELHGYLRPNELIGKNAFDLIVPKDRKEALTNLAKTLKTGFVRNMEYTLLKKDGSTFIGELNAALLRNENGRPNAFIATTRDVTRYKYVEQELTRVKDHLQAVLDGIDEAIVVIDRKYRIVSHNEAFAKSLRKAKDKTVGKKCFYVIHNSRKACRSCVIREMFKTGVPQHDIHYHLEKEGKIYHEVKAYPIMDENGKIMQSIYVFRDVTERETMYERIKQANKRLEELNTMKSYFISIANHELRTPLAIIKGYVDVIKGGLLGDVNAKQRDKLEAISINIVHLDCLVDNILDLSKIESGDLELSLRKVDLRRIASSVVDDFAPIANERGVVLKTRFSRDIPKVRADADRLKQVLINLLDNALKFTGSGGKVFVSVGKTRRYVVLKVVDTGVGIPKAKQAKIFKSFYQADSTRKRKYKGVGLGLAICKSIVELHGGFIKVVSRVNKGTSVSVKLPI